MNLKYFSFDMYAEFQTFGNYRVSSSLEKYKLQDEKGQFTLKEFQDALSKIKSLESENMLLKKVFSFFLVYKVQQVDMLKVLLHMFTLV